MRATRQVLATYTQVPGVQLHLLLQLREQLVVERLQLDKERTHVAVSTTQAGGRGGRRWGGSQERRMVTTVP